jgi:hypothetical protein
MARVGIPHLPRGASTAFEKELVRSLDTILRNHAQAINQNASGRLSSWTASSDVAPTAPGSPGDTVRNTNPAVIGTEGSRYIVDGWRFGDDDTWHEITHLTDE